VAPPTDAERFLRAAYDSLLDRPRELIRPLEIGGRLGLAEDEVQRLLGQLQAARWILCVGSPEAPSDAGVLVTRRGYHAVLKERGRGAETE
jgi:hypothetical protein